MRTRIRVHDSNQEPKIKPLKDDSSKENGAFQDSREES